jgi:predicted nucleic acid-binding protein
LPTLRVVLDTNVLVSGFAYPTSVPGRIIGAWRQGGLDVVLSRYILQPILGTLLASKADYLITGDRDLLALAQYYPILAPASFWDRHGG